MKNSLIRKLYIASFVSNWMFSNNIYTDVVRMTHLILMSYTSYYCLMFITKNDTLLYSVFESLCF